MELEEALLHAMDGNALLFLGAGFSLGASNNVGQSFPLANNLSELLMTALGESDKVQLQTASELYIEKRGEVGLLDFLNKHLGVKDVARHHRSFARPHWRRIYTTNYDAVFETAARLEGRQVRPLVLTPNIPTLEHGSIDCVHINGYLAWTNVANFNSSLILSETSYLTNRFVDTNWVRLFRSDVEAARAVIFVGYSLADLDISRILVAVESVRRKCVFVVGPKPSLELRTTIKKFGSMSPLEGAEPASRVLDDIGNTYKPTSPRVEFSSFRPAKHDGNLTAVPTAREVFDLFVKGEIKYGHLANSLSNPTPSYLVQRAEVAEIADAFDRGAPVVVVLSKLANGKTVLSESMAVHLGDRFDTFVFTRETLTLADEIRELRSPARPTLIVIDDYARHFGVINQLRLGAGNNQYLLLTSRTSTHLTNRPRLEGLLGDAAPIEFRVDTLRDVELQALDSILAGAGLLGGTAGWPRRRRIEELYRTRGGSEFGGILLWLLESPSIREKLAEAFSSLKENSNAGKIVIAAMVLTHIGQIPDIDDIAEFIGANVINQAIFSEDEVVADLIRYDRRTAYPRSSLFAMATLRSLWDEERVPDVLEQMLRRAWELRSESRRYFMIARDLMRYSYLRQIVPTVEPARHVQSYYDRIRNLPACTNNELFWLQFCLADIERKQFDLAERHLEQSYSIAKRMKGYDSYQLDNVRALFLLSREINQPDPNRAFRSFVDASAIINRQMRGRNHAYYPYRVASHYGQFWEQIANRWPADQKAAFISACQAVYRFSNAIDPDLALVDDVVRCREKVKAILDEAGVGAAD